MSEGGRRAERFVECTASAGPTRQTSGSAAVQAAIEAVVAAEAAAAVSASAASAAAAHPPLLAVDMPAEAAAAGRWDPSAGWTAEIGPPLSETQTAFPAAFLISGPLIGSERRMSPSLGGLSLSVSRGWVAGQLRPFSPRPLRSPFCVARSTAGRGGADRLGGGCGLRADLRSPEPGVPPRSVRLRRLGGEGGRAASGREPAAVAGRPAEGGARSPRSKCRLSSSVMALITSPPSRLRVGLRCCAFLSSVCLPVLSCRLSACLSLCCCSVLRFLLAVSICLPVCQCATFPSAVTLKHRGGKEDGAADSDGAYHNAYHNAHHNAFASWRRPNETSLRCGSVSKSTRWGSGWCEGHRLFCHAPTAAPSLRQRLTLARPSSGWRLSEGADGRAPAPEPPAAGGGRRPRGALRLRPRGELMAAAAAVLRVRILQSMLCEPHPTRAEEGRRCVLGCAHKTLTKGSPFSVAQLTENGPAFP